jgi:hypothetical protein
MRLLNDSDTGSTARTGRPRTETFALPLAAHRDLEEWQPLSEVDTESLLCLVAKKSPKVAGICPMRQVSFVVDNITRHSP